MYHIKEDKRMKQSAGKLLESMFILLRSKGFGYISVSDLRNHSGVSRSTFYRLFDIPVDIIAWGCDQYASTLKKEYARLFDVSPSREDFIHFSLRRWMGAGNLLDAVIASRREDLLQSAIRSNAGEDTVPVRFRDAEPRERLYLEAAASAALSSILLVWVRSGRLETPAQLVELFSKVI